MVDVERIGSRLDRLEHHERDLGDKLAAAAGQRNVLVHMYLDIDDREVFAALDRLDDLRRFAAAVQRVADSK